MTSCSITDGVSLQRCRAPGAVPVEGMCVHEHYETALACPRHFNTPFLYCAPCYLHDGHLCPMDMRADASAPGGTAASASTTPAASAAATPSPSSATPPPPTKDSATPAQGSHDRR